MVRVVSGDWGGLDLGGYSGGTVIVAVVGCVSGEC